MRRSAQWIYLGNIMEQDNSEQEPLELYIKEILALTFDESDTVNQYQWMSAQVGNWKAWSLNLN